LELGRRKSKPEYDALKWLPALIVVFFAFRALVLTKHVDFIANYLEKIEKHFALPDSLGFEQQFKNKGTLKRFSAYVFWGLLFVGSVIIPCAYKA
jgi:hypothetical protein